MRILLADDDRVYVAQLSARLKAVGFEVGVAFDAAQASISAFRQAPDVIVLDIGMPGGTGVEVLKRLKQSPMTRRIPIVVVSGNEDPEIEKEVRAAGISDYLKKPADFTALHEAVRRALPGGRAEVEAQELD